MANRVSALGALDKEVQAKLAAKYDHAREAQAREFIRSCTSVSIPAGPDAVHKALKDGTVLCQLMNAVRPGSVRTTKPQKLAFKQMEMIADFLENCQKLGVPVSNLFQTVDLFEAQNMGQVILCLNSLEQVAHGRGRLESHAHADLKTDPTAINLQMGYNKGANQSGQNFGLGRQIMPNAH